MNELEGLKVKINILHERLENLEKTIETINFWQLRQLQNDINNIKVLLDELKE